MHFELYSDLVIVLSAYYRLEFKGYSLFVIAHFSIVLNIMPPQPQTSSCAYGPTHVSEISIQDRGW